MINISYQSEQTSLILQPTSDMLSTNADAMLPQMQKALELYSADGKLTRVELDLTLLRMVDSVGLNLIFAILTRAKEMKIESIIAVKPGPVDRIVQVAQLGRLFKIVKRA